MLNALPPCGLVVEIAANEAVLNSNSTKLISRLSLGGFMVFLAGFGFIAVLVGFGGPPGYS
jgi:hypothetical protein